MKTNKAVTVVGFIIFVLIFGIAIFSFGSFFLLSNIYSIDDEKIIASKPTPNITEMPTSSPPVVAIEPPYPNWQSEYNPSNSENFYVNAVGDKIILRNNISAKYSSYTEVVNFVMADETDKLLFVEDYFMCGDSAEMLHNNAERAGIVAYFVCIDYLDDENKINYHALNAFQTTDAGLIYIDCSPMAETHDLHCDGLGNNVFEGGNYYITDLYPNNENSLYETDKSVVGTITLLEIYK